MSVFVRTAFALVLMIVAGCDKSSDSAKTATSEVDPTISAIEDVLAHDERIVSHAKNEIERGCDRLASITWMVDELRIIDLTACPVDFREAHVRFAGAWEQILVHLDFSPKGAEAFWESFLAGLNKEPDPGDERQRKFVELYHSMASALNDVELVAVRHNAKIPK
jgi:hypothetical protein